ncbi:BspA family leucine-rich repeat surface protein [Carnobacterium maltaromaticum]|uniref:BspA family leucine-rich repeat surface protein n=1 Tax=Carnobacterium maltaromaticum TaxID=2751 RepID=UPI00191BADBF|nr:BspA family leucine-rich repeat surface protein [Carnobacterium maltaromaticum]CAD5903104.1 hypothetical protein CMALT394_630026 [Carnobacterium maltaromaticum]
MKKKLIILNQITLIAVLFQILGGSISVVAETFVESENILYEEQDKEINSIEEEVFLDVEDSLIHEELDILDEIENDSTSIDLYEDSTINIDSERGDLDQINEIDTSHGESSEGTIIASGIFGTSNWRIFDDGLLIIGTGTLGPTGSGSSITPWYPSRTQITRVEFEQDVIANSNSTSLFQNLVNVEEFIGLEHLDTSNVTSMQSMFDGMTRLAELNLSSFDTSEVTTMEKMFHRMISLTNLDISNFDTSKVENMHGMFEDVRNISKLVLNNFDTSNVVNMSRMFRHTNNLVEVDLSSFITTNVTQMIFMFNQANSLTSLNISNFNTSNVTRMDGMFERTNSLIELDISNFDTSSVTNMSNMFGNMHSLVNLDISSFDTRNVTNMSMMFTHVRSLEELDLSSFDTGYVTNMTYMFGNMQRIIKLNISSFDTKNVLNMSSMFTNTTSLVELDISNFDTNSVTNMSGMFHYSTSLEELDLSNFDTRNVTTMMSMFNNARGLKKLDISSFNTMNANTNIGSMFNSAVNLQTLILGSEFRFTTDNGLLPQITRPGYTGRWIGENTGLTFESSTDFMTHFAGDADTFIWEEIRNIEVTLPVSMLFNSNREDTTLLESSEYTIVNRSTHPVNVSVTSLKEEQNIEEIDVLKINEVQLIENGQNSLSGEDLLTTIPVNEKEFVSYSGQASIVHGEVNPSFTLSLKFSF